MPQRLVVEDRDAAVLLVVDHVGQLRLSDHFVLQTYVLNTVGGVGITRGLDHAAVVVEGEFVLEAISQGALIKRHVALEQLEIKRDVEAVAESIGNGFVSCNCLIFISSIDSKPRCVSVIRHVDALVLVVIPLWGCLPEICVTIEDVTVVGAEDLIPRDLDGRLFHNGAAKVLNYGPVGVFRNQHDSEDQAGSPWDDDFMSAKVGKPNKQLLVLVNCARVIRNNHGLPYAFDPQGLTEAPVGIECASEFAARSHGVFEPTQQPSNERVHYTTRWMTSLSKTPRSTLTGLE